MRELLEALVVAAGKGAHIARVASKHCISKRKQEKTGGEANPRFKEDFKTLADVLIQETLRYDLINKFPSLQHHVLGEESNTFCNLNGDAVSVEMKESEQATAQMLAALVDTSSARDLAQAAHAFTPAPDLSALPENYPKLDMNNIGIWIDPIDCTSEFIDGEWGEQDSEPWTELYAENLVGLPCVTVLIGAFLRDSGEPIVGIISQPFFNKDTARCVWGVCYGNQRAYSNGLADPPTGVLTMSGSENSVLPQQFMSAGFRILHPPGAGLKLLMTIVGVSDGYVLSRDTTFRWDTCGPHGILRALGGDIVSFSPPHLPLRYNLEAVNKDEDGAMRFANRGGIIAYRHYETFEKIKNTIHH